MQQRITPCKDLVLYSCSRNFWASLKFVFFFFFNHLNLTSYFFLSGASTLEHFFLVLDWVWCKIQFFLHSQWLLLLVRTLLGLMLISMRIQDCCLPRWTCQLLSTLQIGNFQDSIFAVVWRALLLPGWLLLFVSVLVKIDICVHEWIKVVPFWLTMFWWLLCCKAAAFLFLSSFLFLFSLLL